MEDKEKHNLKAMRTDMADVIIIIIIIIIIIMMMIYSAVSTGYPTALYNI